MEKEEKSIFSNFKFADVEMPTKLVDDENGSNDPAEKEETAPKDKVDEAEKAALEEADRLSKERSASKKESKKNTKEKIDSSDEQEDEEEEESENKEELEDKEELDSTDFNNKQEEKTDDDGSGFKDFAKFLSDEGVIDFEEDSFDDSIDGLKNSIEQSISSGINKYIDSMPEDGKKFLDFVQNGGRPADFHKYYYGEESFEDYKIENEDQGKYIIRKGLQFDGYNDDEIEEELEDIDRLGNWEKKSGMYLKKIQKEEERVKEDLINAQKEYAQKVKADNEREWKEFEDGLFKSETIGGFKMSKKIKNDLWDYMTKPVDSKTGLTEYQIDSNKNKDARYIFAYLLKNKWDIKSLGSQVSTREVSKLRSKLSKYSDTGGKVKTPIKEKIKDNDKAEFGAFRDYLKQ